MKPEDAGRRAAVELSFDGVDITEDMRRFFLDLSYTDNEEDETDDLQLTLQDREGLWLKSWLNDAMDAAASGSGGSGFLIRAAILRKNWKGDGATEKLDCGSFELDSVKVGGPPSVVKIKATSLPFSTQARQTEKTQAWEAYFLSGILNEIAGRNGMEAMFLPESDPYYARREQFKTSDITFLEKLCHDAGLSLKCTNNRIVIFDQATFEANAPVLTLRPGRIGHEYTKYDLDAGAADTQYATCRVSYTDPESGVSIEAVAKSEDADKKNTQQLEITAKVASVGEAEALAKKMLRLHNKYGKTVAFTLPGNPALVAGCTFDLEGWGPWSGRYIISQAKHSVKKSGGYTVQIKGRRRLNGY